MAFEPMHVDDVAAWEADTDVLVVGFGGAGSCAAIAAADAGATVHLFEAASDAGGSTALSSAEIYLGGGTAVQKAVGYDDSVESVFGYLMDCNGPQADPVKTRAYAEGGAAHLDWLMSLGVPFKMSECRDRAMMVLTDDCLLYTGNEKSWPFVERYPPAPRCYRARQGVILCAGGFVMNEDMVSTYAPELQRGTVPIGNPNDTGSGIQMGLSIGGRAINMHEGFISIPFYPPATLTHGIFVNGRGERFVNEDAYNGRVCGALLQQPTPIYLVLNTDDYEGYETQSWLSAPIAGTGETLDELASELDLPAGQLAQTIARYNEAVTAGHDPLHQKQRDWLKPLSAPLVALDCTPGAGAFFPYFTLGGLDTTVDGEVITNGGETIPGLYAAGRTACGVPRRGDGYASGTSVGDATFSGRRAGMAAALSPGGC